MKVKTTGLAGVLQIELDIHEDNRGCFSEVFVQSRYADLGISQPFVQDNYSFSKKHVLRGLHVQKQYPQGKLLTVWRGCIWDVVVDINPHSSTFQQHVCMELEGIGESSKMQQLWIPAGYAHGFCVLSDEAAIHYKCTDVYHPEDEAGICWADIDLNIAWPINTPIISQRDAQLPSLQTFIQQKNL